MRPAVDAGGRSERTSNVAKFSVFEEEEMLPRCYLLQPCDGDFGPVIDDIGVSFEDADVVTNFFRQTEELDSRVNISGNTEVRALDRDQAHKVAREWRYIG